MISNNDEYYDELDQYLKFHCPVLQHYHWELDQKAYLFWMVMDYLVIPV